MRFKVGDLAYPGYTPQKAGVVISVGPADWVTIRDLKGRESSSQFFSDYRALIEDHRRKYQRHEEIAARLDAMFAGSAFRAAVKEAAGREAALERLGVYERLGYHEGEE